MWLTDVVKRVRAQFSSSKKREHPKLKGLHPSLQFKVNALLERCRKEGLHVDVFMGLRTFRQQNALYAKGRSKPGKKVTNAKGGLSWHNYGLAVDIVFRPGSKWSWKNSHDWSKLGKLGKEYGLEWGGDWKNFNDRPHFQLTGGLKISTALRLYKDGGLERVWKEVDKLRNVQLCH